MPVSTADTSISVPLPVSIRLRMAIRMAAEL